MALIFHKLSAIKRDIDWHTVIAIRGGRSSVFTHWIIQSVHFDRAVFCKLHQMFLVANTQALQQNLSTFSSSCFSYIYFRINNKREKGACPSVKTCRIAFGRQHHGGNNSMRSMEVGFREVTWDLLVTIAVLCVLTST